MDIKLHQNASTTPRTRKYIQTSEKSDTQLARELGISIDTVRRWRSRDGVFDKSHRPKNIHKRLSEQQEYLILYIRHRLSLSLDELLEVSKLLINKNLSRAVLSRCLQKYSTGRVARPKAGQSGKVVVDVFPLPESLSSIPTKLVIFTELYSSFISVALIENDNPKATENLTDFLKHSLPYTIKLLQIPAQSFLQEVAECLRVPFEIQANSQLLPEPVTGDLSFNSRLDELLNGEYFDQRQSLGATLLEYEDILNKSVIRNRLGKLTPNAYLSREV